MAKTYAEIFEKAKTVIGEENIIDYRPAVIGNCDEVIYAVMPLSITIWLKKGDCLIYRDCSTERKENGCGWIDDE